MYTALKFPLKFLKSILKLTDFPIRVVTYLTIFNTNRVEEILYQK